MALNDYIIEEIAHDHADGLIDRREAMRKLATVGMSVAAAGTVLASVPMRASAATKTRSRKATTKKAASTTSAPTTAAPTTAAPTTAPPTTAAPATTVTTAAARPAVEEITFNGPAGRIFGAYSAAPSPKGGVLIIHEIGGVTDHFRELASRFAASGYSALSIDLLSRVGGTAAVASQLPGPLLQLRTQDLVEDMRAGVAELSRRVPGKKLGVTGFCFGGGMVWSFLTGGDARVFAAVPFYGPGVTGSDFLMSKHTAVLGVYAENDQRVNATRDAMRAALVAAGMTNEFRTYPGVDHAFFNNTGARFNATQAGLAYQATIEWFDKYLK